MSKNKIKNITARYIIDSRGNPTVEADVILPSGIIGRASVPSGASTGEFEANELRDGGPEYSGRGVIQAINNIHNKIKPLLLGHDINDITKIDYLMIKNDGTNNKSNFGANATLAVSLACLKAGAQLNRKKLYEYINLQYPSKMSIPMPMMNIINGGTHADNLLDIQEFMIYPIGFETFSDALRAGVEIFHKLKIILKKNNYSTGIGDEGGFAPSLKNNEEALSLIIEAIDAAKYEIGKEICLALDVASSEIYNKKINRYEMKADKKKLDTESMINYYKNLIKKYPIISIEDPLYENNFKDWGLLNKVLGKKIQIVGDDLTTTNPTRLKRAIKHKSINAILIKLNQIGTFTETMETIILAKNNNLGTIISHRSGETEDTTISDLAVACNAGQIKTGSLCRTDRVAKYNRLLRIQELNNQKIQFAKKQKIKCIEKTKNN